MTSIGLYNIKNIWNFGAVCRLAGCYNVSSVLIEGSRFKKSAADTTKFYRHHPVMDVDDLISSRPKGLIPVGVEIDDRAEDLVNYRHFKDAFYCFGAEDAGLSQGIMDRCEEIIKIPSKFCLNLSVTVGTVLYDRELKEKLFGFKKKKKQNKR